MTATVPTDTGSAASLCNICKALVANNFDPVAKADAADHLEMQLLNDS